MESTGQSSNGKEMIDVIKLGRWSAL